MISRKTAEMLEFNLILEKLAGRAVSEAGKKLVLGIVPSDSIIEARRLMDETRQAETLLLRRSSGPLKNFDMVDGELSRLNTGASLNISELLSLTGVYKAAKHASDSIMHEEDAELLKQTARLLFFDEYVIKTIDTSIESDGSIADRASDNLYKIRCNIRHENEYIREKLQKIIKNSDFASNLSDNIVTQRNGRYVVPVKQEYRQTVSGIVHAQSGSGATLFIEPASVVEANNRISELTAAEEAEIEVILSHLSGLFMPHTDEIKKCIDALAYLDVIFARASYAISINATPVEFNERQIFHVKHGRHPLINPDTVIPIDVEMNENIHSLVITGPNTGGKTVTLKLCGLFVLMAQSGMFVPADYGVKLPLFDAVFADIGDEQSISQSLSTFSSHLTNINYILRHATGTSLVLLDELGAGTEPQEGAALAMAVLDSLSDRGSMILATTHYSDLKKYAAGRDGFENASMEFDAVALRPTYRLLVGVPGMSNALLIAKRLGLKKDVLDCAFGYLGAERRSFVDIMGEAQKAGSRAKQQEQKADDMHRQAEKYLEDAKRTYEKAEAKAKKMLQKADEKALEIVSEASDESEHLIAEAKKLAARKESERIYSTKRIRDSFDKRKEKINRNLNRQKRKGQPLKPTDVREGMDVRIISMDVQGTVLKVPDSKGMVNVQAGIMKVDVHCSDLEAAEAVKENTVKRTSSVQLNRNRSVSMEIDLHGMAVDDACILLDKYLDDAFVSGLTQVYIIHGRGTGVLKAGVRAFLRKHTHVKSIRAGEYGEGGDGVTVTELK